MEFGKKRSTVGFDVSKQRVEELADGVDRTQEIAHQELKQSKHLMLSDNIDSLRDCDIYIVTVPTPVDKSNVPDLGPLLGACQLIGSVLRPGGLVIFESTVFPGCTEELCVPELARESNLQYNKDFFVGYSPERVNPGDKQNSLVNIIKITSGSTTDIAAEVDELYKSIISVGTYKAASIAVAEAAKVIENSQRDLNIAFVNELSHIFNKLGIDTLDVLEAAGTKWNFLPFRPGLVGGHCIGVDPYYLTHRAEQAGYHPEVILAGRRINDAMAAVAARETVKLMSKNGLRISGATVAVFGVTFKDNCPDIRNSKVFDFVAELREWGIKPVLIDPWADGSLVEAECGLPLTQLSQVVDVDSIVVTVGHGEFSGLSPEFFRSICAVNKPVFGDLKSTYPRDALQAAGFTVYRL